MAIFKPASLAMTLSLSLMLGGCMIAKPLSAAEEEVKAELDVSNYYPATREMRGNIETQPLFAQAAFWGREYDLNPSDLESAIRLSSAVRKLGNPQRAIEIAQTTRALYPRDPYLAAEFAAALIASERALDAMQPLDEALRVAPNYARLWSLKGAALDQTEQYELARQHYDRALRITPNDPNILANLGLSYALAGDPVTAETWLRRASALPGAGAGVRQNLALVLQLQGKTQEASKLARLSRGDQKLPPPPVPAQQLRGQTAPNPTYGRQSSQTRRLRGRTARPQAFGQQTSRPQNLRPQNSRLQNLRGPQPQAFAPTAAPAIRKSSNQTRVQKQATAPKAKLAASKDLTDQQRSLLDQIAGNLNPQYAKQERQRQQAGQAQTRQTQNGQIQGYPAQAYAPQGYGPQSSSHQAPTYQASNTTPRGAARRRR